MIRYKTTKSKMFDTFNIIFLIFLCILCLMPLWYTFCLSLSSKAAAAAGTVSLWPVDFNLEAYKALIQDMNFFRSFWVSIRRVLWSLVVLFFTVIIMAFPLSRSKKEFPMRNAFMWILVFFWMFHGGLVPWFMTMKNYGLTNSALGLALAGGLPIYNIILVMNYYRNLPKAIDEAARIDGAGAWAVLFRIYLPMSLPVIATVVLFTVVGQWNEFFQGLVLTSYSADYPLQTYIQQMVVTMNTEIVSEAELEKISQLSNKTLNAAKVFVAMVPVLCIYPFLQKYFVQGITLGAVKE